MSNYSRMSVNPVTDKLEMATWIDDYFGPHKYGVGFPSGNIYRADAVIAAEEKLSGRTTSSNAVTSTPFERLGRLSEMNVTQDFFAQKVLDAWLACRIDDNQMCKLCDGFGIRHMPQYWDDL